MRTSQFTKWMGWQHTAVILLFLLISLAIAWPIPHDFTSRIASDNLDSRHHLWVLWHVKEWLLGHQAYADLNLLFYPYGLDYRAHGMGPIMPLLALPFWHWGPAAAFNGALLLGLTLTGYGMYLLARSLKFRPTIAFVAGLLFLLTPIHLAGIYGHLHKVFLGLSAVSLLTLHYALNRERSPQWAAVTGLLLLLLLFHNGYQFVITSLMLAFFC